MTDWVLILWLFANGGPLGALLARYDCAGYATQQSCEKAAELFVKNEKLMRPYYRALCVRRDKQG
jgi:hypothetical protein